MTKNHMDVPLVHELINPTIQALKELGGSGTVDEINEKVIEIMSLPDRTIEIQHRENGETEIAYRLAWARTCLRKVGIFINSERSVWTISQTAKNISKLNSKEVVNKAKALPKGSSVPDLISFVDNRSEDAFIDKPNEIKSWEERLYNILTSMEPSAFERLIQRVLRESGFVQVEVTGRSGDDGIDGKGIARINGLLSFHVMFQCKRYKGAVSPNHIRDFRGALQGRADRGLFITTGSFSKNAIMEADRDGALYNV